MYLTQSTLELLHIFFRHGHRTPALPAYPKNLYKHLTFQPYGRGQLTNEGKRETYKLGQYIRNQYGEFINENYQPGILKATCTQYDRTKTSLQLFLTGLFPPRGPLEWNPKLAWQPIPYTCIPKNKDYLFHASDFCKDFIPMYNRHHDELELPEKYKHVYNHIEKHSGRKIKTAYDIYEIYFNMTTEQEWGLELPEWALSVYPELITHIAALHYVITCGTPYLRSCSIETPLFEIIAHTLQKTANKAVKLYLYSCHEVNVAHFLIGLGSFQNPHVPNYCSCLVLEIHRIDDELFVKGLYKPDVLSEFKLMHLWGENPCSFTEFVKYIHSNFK